LRGLREPLKRGRVGAGLNVREIKPKKILERRELGEEADKERLWKKGVLQ